VIIPHDRAVAAKSILAAAVFLSWLAANTGAQHSSVNPDIPYIPTPHEVVERMLGLAGVGPDDFVIDLGSGDGRILIGAAKRGARGFGVEIDPRLVKQSNENALKAGVGLNISFIQQDLFETSLRPATVVAMYLPPQVNFRLRPRLLELGPGTHIVSHEFAMAGWLPDLQENVRGTEIFLWIVPARVAGEWTLKLGDREITLQFKQLFQELTGVSRIGGVEIPLGVARLRGDQLEVVVQKMSGIPMTLTGIVDGDTIRSTPDSDEKWIALKKKPGD